MTHSAVNLLGDSPAQGEIQDINPLPPRGKSVAILTSRWFRAASPNVVGPARRPGLQIPVVPR